MSAAGENFEILAPTYGDFLTKMGAAGENFGDFDTIHERRRRKFWGLGRHYYNPALNFENENLEIL